jgi:cell wall-associated NlpC family hydrolase
MTIRSLDMAQPGDVLIRYPAISESPDKTFNHVGVYLGAGRFVHAPHRGVAVASADLSEGFFAHHLVNAGRFWGAVVSSP